MARRKKGQRVHGWIVVDKPAGITSTQVVGIVKRVFDAQKAGHAGTLDPLASGLLLLLFGEATKFAGPLLDADKEYLASIKLGERTATGDSEGEVVEKKGLPADLAARVPGVLGRFTGRIEQVPPMYSALKHQGLPLYQRARRGETVERPARSVEIFELEPVRLHEHLLELRIRCSKGTYIRTLAEDIGRELGTAAHLASLRRTRSGGFSVAEAVSLEALEAMGEADRERRARRCPSRGARGSAGSTAPMAGSSGSGEPMRRVACIRYGSLQAAEKASENLVIGLSVG
jgi:tRNA pseudouridine55 synthase